MILHIKLQINLPGDSVVYSLALAGAYEHALHLLFANFRIAENVGRGPGNIASVCGFIVSLT